MARPPAIADNAAMTLDLFPDEPAVEQRDAPDPQWSELGGE